jgi:hypothetical protein
MKPAPELRDLTIQIAQAVSDGDVAVLERHTSRHSGTAFLGTDPAEWWTDLSGLRQALVGQREAGVTFISGDPVAYQEGTIGWAVDHRMRFRVGEHEGPFRMTVVYRQEDGVWKMVHFHSSIGVSNADAIGVELPT